MSTPESKSSDERFNRHGETLAKIAIGGAALLSSTSTASATMRPIPPGIKIGTSAPPATEENMIYLKQLGVTWVSLNTSAETPPRKASSR